MKAAVRTTYGPPDVVRISDVDRPTIKDHDVLVKVHATTVNRTDCALLAAEPFIVRFFAGLVTPRASVLGGEFAGVVDALGSRVTTFTVGDRVFGYREGSWGAHAEYLSMPDSGRLAVMPAHVSFEQAAPSIEGAQYALSFLHTAKIQSGQSVLVYGATGAIGSAAVQLLKSVGAVVTAVCDTANMELVKGLGADRVVDYTATDFTADEQRYDAVFDAVGKSSFGRCKRLLKRRGVYLSSDLGRFAQNITLPLMTPVFGGKRVKFPMQKLRGQAMVRYVQGLIESGEFKPVIDRTYSLDEIVEAYRYVEAGRKIGNVVISVVPPN